MLLYTGLRRGDAVRSVGSMSETALRRSRPKRAETVYGDASDPAGARRTLAAGPCGDLTFIVGERASRWPRNHSARCSSKGCPRRWRDGIGARRPQDRGDRAAKHGATVAQLNAIFGWSGGAMARHYTREADRSGCPSRRCTSWRTLHEHLYPHL